METGEIGKMLQFAPKLVAAVQNLKQGCATIHHLPMEEAHVQNQQHKQLDAIHNLAQLMEAGELG